MCLILFASITGGARLDLLSDRSRPADEQLPQISKIKEH